MSAPLLIRADASAAIGTGHVMRMIALAHAWSARGGEALLASAELPEGLLPRLAAEGIPVERLDVEPAGPADLEATVALARSRGAAHVVVDGYRFGADFQEGLRVAGLRQLFVDDYGHASRYFADLVLNQNAYAAEAPYADRAPHTRLLLGSRYAMLRREFWRWRGWERTLRAEGRRILVTLGGADPDDVTSRVLLALGRVRGVRPLVVVGGGNPHAERIARIAADTGAELRRAVPDMAPLMAEADLAIAAGGTTCWELCFLGLPSLVVALADNQRPVQEVLAARDAAVSLGWHEQLDEDAVIRAVEALLADVEARRRLSEAGRRLVDGWGGERVAATLRADVPLFLRAATAADSRRVWEINAEPSVRARAIHSDPIRWEAHQGWYRAAVEDPARRLLVAETEGEVVGVVRLDLAGVRASISIALAPEARGRGHGRWLIRAVTEAALAEPGVEVVEALIRPDNAPSRRAFEAAGYRETGVCTVAGVELAQYEHRGPA